MSAEYTVVTDGKNVVLQKPKFNIVSEFIPYSTFTNNTVSTHSSVSLHELGKQLVKAAANGDADELKTLLTRGAPFTADWLGTSPLHLAAQNNHLEVTEMLLRAGLSKEARTKVDRSPLHLASYAGHLQIVDSLVKHGADIDCRDMLGMTPLHWATQNGHLQVVDYLICKGANLTMANKFDLTPLDIAIQISRTDIQASLESALCNRDLAAQNLVIQLTHNETQNADIDDPVLGTEDIDMEDGDETPIIIPLEPHLISQLEQQDDDLDAQQIEEEMNFDGGISNHSQSQDIEDHEETLVHSITINPENLSDSLKLLQQHGITLQNENEDNNILNTVMESGHSVVLTEVGKEVLNSVKEAEQLQQKRTKPKKLFTITPDGLLKVNNEPVQKTITKPIKIRRIMMKRNKCTPLGPVVNVLNENKPQNTIENGAVSDMECIMKELIEARQTIEEYKIKLHKKEQEAERYKMQLKLFMDAS